MRSITYELDEFHPFRAPNGDEISVIVYGDAEIEYDDEDWWVSSITLDAGHRELLPSNLGAPQRSRWVSSKVELDRTSPLWALISNAIVEHCSESIDGQVAFARNHERENDIEMDWKSARTDAAFAESE